MSKVTLQLGDAGLPVMVDPAELELIAAAREPGGIRLIEGDNLAIMETLIQEGVKAHLAYLDPPFFTQRVHKRVHRRRRPGGGVERTDSPAFDDRWPDLATYLSALRERLVRVRELLTPDGCVIVHVDPTTSHYIKVMCDELFGVDAFASELIWRYRRWPAKTKNFQRVHDVLLRYQRDPRQEPRFQQLYEPLAPSTVATWGKTKQLADVNAEGRRVRSTRTEEASPGVPMGDVWELSVIAPVAKERTGYPTQKPARLLTRVVQACSYPGDLVLDPYAGSGTTLAVAASEGRQAIGIDASPEAIEVALARLESEGRSCRHERALRQPNAGPLAGSGGVEGAELAHGLVHDDGDGIGEIE